LKGYTFFLYTLYSIDFNTEECVFFQIASNDGDEGNVVDQDVQPGSKHLLTPESKAAVESRPERVAGGQRSSLGMCFRNAQIFHYYPHFALLVTVEWLLSFWSHD
jgi:hypothetical protein